MVGRIQRAKPGDYLVQCDKTGFTRWASECQKEWNGNLVWERVFEPRQPQDYLRGIPDDPSVPDPRPEGVTTFIGPLVTQINASHSAGDVSLTVVSSVRMAVSDRLNIVLDSGDTYFTTILTVDDATTITVNDALPGATSAGNKVIDYSAVSAATIE